MTTREEFALGFAIESYRLAMARLYESDTTLTEETGDKIDQSIVHGAVIMADLLIDELAKEKESPIRPTS